MKDADELIGRILMFEGHPNVQKLGATTVGEHADWFEGQLDAIERVGVQQYLARQVVTSTPGA